ncbi:MAG: TraR/DksA C4-type zinc finger protein [Bacteroidetes bacterium]|nr:TraR/DksA C4-type zinc finger protein [Bacteroidota bacterium]
MDLQQTKEVKKLIENEISKTILKIEEYKELTQPISPENAIGRISRMDAINNKSVAEAALREAQTKLQSLQYMLTKTGNKDFGQCAKCNGQIPIGRMMIMPQSRFCVNCAQ